MSTATFRLSCIAGLLAAMASTPALAATSFFNTATSFAAATQGPSAFGFAAIAPPTSFVSLPGGVTVGPASFASNGDIFAVGANGGFGGYGVAKLDAQTPPATPLVFNVALAGGYTAASFSVASYVGIFNIQLTVNGVDQFLFTTPSNPGVGVGFVGFTSTVPISSVSFRTLSSTVNNAGGAWALDITGFQVAQAVPEPASATLALAGLALLGLVVRRR